MCCEEINPVPISEYVECMDKAVHLFYFYSVFILFSFYFL